MFGPWRRVRWAGGPDRDLAVERITGLTSQIAASVPGRFFEARFLSGGENGRFLVDRA